MVAKGGLPVPENRQKSTGRPRRSARNRYAADVDRQPPRVTSNAIDLYIRTYYSLLRSSGDVRVRAFEEAHVFSEGNVFVRILENVRGKDAFIVQVVDPEIVAVKKGEKNQANEVEAITGATISSKAVVRLLQKGIDEWRAPIEEYVQKSGRMEN